MKLDTRISPTVITAVGMAAALGMAVVLVAQRAGDRLERRNEIPKLEQYVSSTVAMLPYASGSGEIGRIVDAAGTLPLGPEAFAVRGDDILILDTVNEKLKAFAAGGVLAREVVVGWGTDLVTTHDGNFLVAVPTEQRVVKVTPVAAEPVPVDSPIERFGAAPAQAHDRAITNSAQPASEQSFHRYGTKLTGAHEGVIEDRENGIGIRVPTTARLGSINFLGIDRYQNIYVIVEELLPNENPDVRRTVRKFTADGALRTIIQIPIDNSTFPARDLIVTDDGAIYHMQPREDAVRIQRWQPE